MGEWEKESERDHLSSCVVGNCISTMSQRTASAVTQALFGICKAQELPCHSQCWGKPQCCGQTEVMPCESWKGASSWLESGAVKSTVYLEFPGFRTTYDLQVALACSTLKQGYSSPPEIEVRSQQWECWILATRPVVSDKVLALQLFRREFPQRQEIMNQVFLGGKEYSICG